MTNGEIYVGDELVSHTGRRKLSDIVAEYEERISRIDDEFAEFERAQTALKAACCVSGVWPYGNLDVGRVGKRQMKEFLLRSAWRCAYKEYNLEYLASASDKSKIERMMEDPPEFNMMNLYEWFGDLAQNPRASILRGLAEVFADLDPAFKSHEKMKVGVKGLPKRVILSSVGDYGWGRDRLLSILNSIAAIKGEKLADYKETSDILDNGDCLRDTRGVWLKRFANGNGHLFFSPDTLKAVNLGLAEYYGDVLPDCPEARPAKKASTEVAKDLQYFPTPKAVIDSVMNNAYYMKGKKVLEPSCGCGRFLEAIAAEGGDVFGIEYDSGRAAEARAKGFKVLQANFLEVAPSPDFDMVVMNPPFYGRHYAKHVRHALEFLKPDGTLWSVLPSTARYDHGELDDLKPYWYDLPVGSFRESGTNISTSVARIRKKQT